MATDPTKKPLTVDELNAIDDDVNHENARRPVWDRRNPNVTNSQLEQERQDRVVSREMFLDEGTVPTKQQMEEGYAQYQKEEEQRQQKMREGKKAYRVRYTNEGRGTQDVNIAYGKDSLDTQIEYLKENHPETEINRVRHLGEYPVDYHEHEFTPEEAEAANRAIHEKWKEKIDYGPHKNLNNIKTKANVRVREGEDNSDEGMTRRLQGQTVSTIPPVENANHPWVGRTGQYERDLADYERRPDIYHNPDFNSIKEEREDFEIEQEAKADVAEIYRNMGKSFNLAIEWKSLTLSKSLQAPHVKGRQFGKKRGVRSKNKEGNLSQRRWTKKGLGDVETKANVEMFSGEGDREAERRIHGRILGGPEGVNPTHGIENATSREHGRLPNQELEQYRHETYPEWYPNDPSYNSPEEQAQDEADQKEAREYAAEIRKWSGKKSVGDVETKANVQMFPGIVNGDNLATAVARNMLHDPNARCENACIDHPQYNHPDMPLIRAEDENPKTPQEKAEERHTSKLAKQDVREIYHAMGRKKSVGDIETKANVELEHPHEGDRDVEMRMYGTHTGVGYQVENANHPSLGASQEYKEDHYFHDLDPDVYPHPDYNSREEQAEDEALQKEAREYAAEIRRWSGKSLELNDQPTPPELDPENSNPLPPVEKLRPPQQVGRTRMPSAMAHAQRREEQQQGDVPPFSEETIIARENPYIPDEVEQQEQELIRDEGANRENIEESNEAPPYYDTTPSPGMIQNQQEGNDLQVAENQEKLSTDIPALSEVAEEIERLPIDAVNPAPPAGKIRDKREHLGRHDLDTSLQELKQRHRNAPETEEAYSDELSEEEHQEKRRQLKRQHRKPQIDLTPNVENW